MSKELLADISTKIKGVKYICSGFLLKQGKVLWNLT